MLFFVAGFGIGYLVDGRSGALWGAGIGLAIGVVLGFALLLVLRQRR